MRHDAFNTSESWWQRYLDKRAALFRVELLVDLYGLPRNIPQPVMTMAVSGAELSVVDGYSYAEEIFAEANPLAH